MNWSEIIPFFRKTGYLERKIKEVTGVKPKNIQIYKTAFTHKSSGKKDSRGHRIDYERMEFLGDALLDAVITDYLYKQMPTGTEGELTKMRSKIVSRRQLNKIGKDMGLVKLLKTGKRRGKYSYNAHGDMLESLVAALYLDRGYETMKKFVYKKLLDKYVDLDTLQNKIQSYKSLIVEWCQKNKKTYRFDISEDEGNETKRYYVAILFIDEKEISKARAISKKKAVEQASKRAYYKCYKIRKK